MENKVEVLDEFQVGPPPGSLPTTLSLPLTVFDLRILIDTRCLTLGFVFFYAYPQSLDHFINTTIPSLKSSLSLVEYGSCVRSMVQNLPMAKVDNLKPKSKKSMTMVLKRNLKKRNEQRRVENVINMLLNAAEIIESDDIGETQRNVEEAKLGIIKDARLLTNNNRDLIAHVLKDEGRVTSPNSECQKIVLDINYKNARSIGAIDEELKKIP